MESNRNKLLMLRNLVSGRHRMVFAVAAVAVEKVSLAME